MSSLMVYVYGADAEPIPAVVSVCRSLVAARYTLAGAPEKADIAVAPLLTRFLSEPEIRAPRLGTLVFHPSLLPRHRGPDAIRWAFRLGESYTGVTWFWPDSGVDTGDICEQEVVAIRTGERPGAFYARAIVSAAVRTLERALADIAAGRLRRVPQLAESATYERKLPKARG